MGSRPLSASRGRVDTGKTAGFGLPFPHLPRKASPASGSGRGSRRNNNGAGVSNPAGRHPSAALTVGVRVPGASGGLGGPTARWECFVSAGGTGAVGSAGTRGCGMTGIAFWGRKGGRTGRTAVASRRALYASRRRGGRPAAGPAGRMMRTDRTDRTQRQLRQFAFRTSGAWIRGIAGDSGTRGLLSHRGPERRAFQRWKRRHRSSVQREGERCDDGLLAS
jgi:hypothetical protein